MHWYADVKQQFAVTHQIMFLIKIKKIWIGNSPHLFLRHYFLVEKESSVDGH